MYIYKCIKNEVNVPKINSKNIFEGQKKSREIKFDRTAELLKLAHPSRLPTRSVDPFVYGIYS